MAMTGKKWVNPMAAPSITEDEVEEMEELGLAAPGSFPAGKAKEVKKPTRKGGGVFVNPMTHSSGPSKMRQSLMIGDPGGQPSQMGPGRTDSGRGIGDGEHQMVGKALGCLEVENEFRIRCFRVIHHRTTEYCILG